MKKELPEGWEEKKLGEVSFYDRRNCDNNDLPYVGMESIESRTGRYLDPPAKANGTGQSFQFTTSHVLYGRLRPYLQKVLRPTFSGRCSTELFPIMPKSELLRDYLFYWLLSESVTNQIGSTCTGARMPRANMDQVATLTINMPNISCQKRIVAILDEAFTAIDRAKENVEKSLLNTSEQSAAYTEMILTDRESRWPRRSLKEICERITDGTHQTPSYFKNGFVFLSSKNVTSGKIDWERVKFIDESQHSEMQRRVSPKIGDVLLAKNGTTGVAAVVDRNTEFDIYVSLALLRPGRNIDSRFLLTFVNSPIAKRQFNRRLKGIGVPNLHLEEIREVELNLPPLPEQRRIVARLDAIRAETDRLEAVYRKKLADLEELKKSILEKAFSGEL